MAYIYIVECDGGTLYTGIATDIQKRIKTHLSGRGNCAKYTRSHKIKRMAALWQTENYADAAKLEYAIKKLRRSCKLRLIENTKNVSEFFPALSDIEFVPCEVLDLSKIEP